jgi:hypothetical protein
VRAAIDANPEAADGQALDLVHGSSFLSDQAIYAGGTEAAADADVIVLLDGDAADDPADLPRILGPLLDGRADLVVGSRTLGTREAGSMKPQQVAGNRVAAWLMALLYRSRVSDLGPFRAIRRADLLGLDMREMTYGWSVEMMVKAARAGYRYHEVPVRYRRRIGVSKVGGTLKGSLWAGWCIVSTVLRYARWRPRPADRRPRRRSRSPRRVAPIGAEHGSAQRTAAARRLVLAGNAQG